MNLSLSRICGTMSRATRRPRSSRSIASRFLTSSAGAQATRAGRDSGGRLPLKCSFTAREIRFQALAMAVRAELAPLAALVRRQPELAQADGVLSSSSSFSIHG